MRSHWLTLPMVIVLAGCVSNAQPYDAPIRNVILSDDGFVLQYLNKRMKFIVERAGGFDILTTGDLRFRLPASCDADISGYILEHDDLIILSVGHGVIQFKLSHDDNLAFAYFTSTGLIEVFWDYNGENSFQFSPGEVTVSMDERERFGFTAKNDKFFYRCQNPA